jgi:hypothetical protein
VADIWKEIDGFIFEGQNLPKECVSVVFFMDIETLKFMKDQAVCKCRTPTIQISGAVL